MFTYIKKSIYKNYIELEHQLAPQNNIGTSWQDYLDDKWILLSDEQIAFKEQYPSASIQEVFNMQLSEQSQNQILVDYLNSYYQEHLTDFYFLGVKVWLDNTERFLLRNEAKFKDEVSLNSEVSIKSEYIDSLIEKMIDREEKCTKFIQQKIEEKSRDVSEFPEPQYITYSDITSNSDFQLKELIMTQINNFDLSDEGALKFKSLYPNWESFQGASLKKGTKVLYNDKLYIVLQDISIVLQEPSIDTAALYAEINETNQGTLSDPIPYNNNMELFKGKYYIQNDVIYLCTRDTGQPVYQNLADLVNLYVEKV